MRLPASRESSSERYCSSNWGGVAFDPERGLVLVNTSRVAHVVTLIPRDESRRRAFV